MSQRTVERTLGKLVTDEAFREAFFRNPASASMQAGLDLSPDEMHALLLTPRSALDALGARLDDRICRLHVSPALHEEQLQ